MATKKQKKRQEKKRRHIKQAENLPVTVKAAAGLAPAAVQRHPVTEARGGPSGPEAAVPEQLAGQPGPAWQPLCRLLVESYLDGYAPLEKKPRAGR